MYLLKAFSASSYLTMNNISQNSSIYYKSNYIFNILYLIAGMLMFLLTCANLCVTLLFIYKHTLNTNQSLGSQSIYNNLLINMKHFIISFILMFTVGFVLYYNYQYNAKQVSLCNKHLLEYTIERYQNEYELMTKLITQSKDLSDSFSYNYFNFMQYIYNQYIEYKNNTNENIDFIQFIKMLRSAMYQPLYIENIQCYLQNSQEVITSLSTLYVSLNINTNNISNDIISLNNYELKNNSDDLVNIFKYANKLQLNTNNLKQEYINFYNTSDTNTIINLQENIIIFINNYLQNNINYYSSLSPFINIISNNNNIINLLNIISPFIDSNYIINFELLNLLNTPNLYNKTQILNALFSVSNVSPNNILMNIKQMYM